jgi:hypothetical protein
VLRRQDVAIQLANSERDDFQFTVNQVMPMALFKNRVVRSCFLGHSILE